MKSHRLIPLLAIIVLANVVRAGEDVMPLFDRGRELMREVKKKQVEYLMQKDPALKNFPMAYFDAPEPAELRDRIAFDYLWKKGHLRNIWNSYLSGTRNMLSEA